MPARRVPADLKLLHEPGLRVSRGAEVGGEVAVGGDSLNFADLPDVLDADGVAEWQRRLPRASWKLRWRFPA